MNCQRRKLYSSGGPHVGSPKETLASIKSSTRHQRSRASDRSDKRVPWLRTCAPNDWRESVVVDRLRSDGARNPLSCLCLRAWQSSRSSACMHSKQRYTTQQCAVLGLVSLPACNWLRQFFPSQTAQRCRMSRGGLRSTSSVIQHYGFFGI